MSPITSSGPSPKPQILFSSVDWCARIELLSGKQSGGVRLLASLTRQKDTVRSLR